MPFEVNYSDEAKQDLKDIYNHIADVLLEPVTAKRKTDRITEKADSLDFMPFRFPAYNIEPWKSKGYRVLYAERYAVLYYPDKSTNRVTIIRIIHGSREIEKHLSIEN
jgi:toxin ParE1/3/4